MKNRSVTQHAFSLVPKVSKPRSVFNRSNGYKTTIDSDYLYPFYFKHILPGDTVNSRHSIMFRLLSAGLKPFMDNLWMDWFYFFIPWRLVWTNFPKFMGEQASPGDSISYTIPQCTGPNVAAGGIALHSLHDYFGLPIGPLSGGGGTTGITFNNLIPRCYNRTWHDWFRDENLQNAPTLDLGDGPDTYTNYILRKRGKRFDYFSSCLPFLQKGTSVTLPLGTDAIVKTGNANYTGAQLPMVVRQASGIFPGANYTLGATNATGVTDWIANTPTVTGDGFYPSNLYADLSTATASSINVLRQSIALQQFLENDARGGTRYTEIVKHRWGVTSPDARLQRVELLSLGSEPIKMHPVAETIGPAAGPTSYLGNLGAFGTGASLGRGFSKSFTEHGLVLGLVMVRADLTYSQGLDRHWSYRTRYDLFNPEFANLGEQAVLNKEIFANVPDGTSSVQKDGVFGYIPRYDEERYSKSILTGLMRPGATGTVAVWNLSELFGSLPTLGDTFIQSSATGPVDRAIAVPSEPQFIMDVYFNDIWARVMPMFSVPGLNKL